MAYNAHVEERTRGPRVRLDLGIWQDLGLETRRSMQEFRGSVVSMDLADDGSLKEGR